jgi:hypothetical protein
MTIEGAKTPQPNAKHYLMITYIYIINAVAVLLFNNIFLIYLFIFFFIYRVLYRG